ncbi:superoxide dismutase family protein [Pseudalkalibacillus decolorationis]|uniref:superoxide dismutase family protein n=1 Tax=Pseudalkalibacillus decolorationis TaxID=163879 RepID=UPI002148C752|nr:superoxide dismutase family protein [Pseudalkalibacillus decolorationis]
MKRATLFLIMLMLVLALAACAGTDDNKENQNEKSKKGTGMEKDNGEKENNKDTVNVNLKNGDGDKVGSAKLKQESNGVRIQLKVSKLSKGTHGFHIHEKGQCKAPDFKSAGGHFNPTDASHGFDHPKGEHAGDLPNIEVGKDGTVEEEFLAKNVTLKKGKENLLFDKDGSALVIHAEADDGKSQPSGDAGDRVACGVISE